MRKALLSISLLAAACTAQPGAAPSESPPAPAPVPVTSSAVPEPSPEPSLALPSRGPVVLRVHRYASLEALVANLTDAERTVRRPGARSEQLAAAGIAQQTAYAQLAATPAWHGAVDRMPRELRAAARANLRAAVELSRLVKPRTELPPWRIVAPPPPAELLGYYRSAQAETGIEWTYLAAIHFVETRMGRIRGTSTAGAQGPMQFLPSTWAEVGRGGDIDDPHDAIHAAARYLVRRGGLRDIRRGLRGYNNSAYYVEAVAAYASVLRAEPVAYGGYYHWPVRYRLVSGDRLLLEGYQG